MTLQNFHAIETEAAYRRAEWHRAVTTATQADQARQATNALKRKPRLLRFLANLGLRPGPNITPTFSPGRSGERTVPIIEGC